MSAQSNILYSMDFQLKPFNEPGSRIIFKPRGDPETSWHVDTVNREFSK